MIIIRFLIVFCSIPAYTYTHFPLFIDQNVNKRSIWSYVISFFFVFFFRGEWCSALQYSHSRKERRSLLSVSHCVQSPKSVTHLLFTLCAHTVHFIHSFYLCNQSATGASQIMTWNKPTRKHNIYESIQTLSLVSLCDILLVLLLIVEN